MLRPPHLPVIVSHRDIAQPRSPEPAPRHPNGVNAKVLLCSVFGPYAQDDEYGSRVINPMELYHNQVTRVQGAFSLRIFHRSWGLMLIQANLAAPCIVLDFPSLDRFIEELRTNQYDIIGVTSIVANVLKVEKMCELIRKYQPHAKIVIGGHVANLENLDERIAADFIVRGDGVRWFRRYLGEDTDSPINHPVIPTPIGMRNVGVPLPSKPADTPVTLIPSVGCPMGCNFCSTSAMFGGKGKWVQFYPTAEDLYDVMSKLEATTGSEAFFVMDENFLLDKKRGLRLLELFEQNDKAYSLYIFSSANVVRQYSMDELVRLGVSWVWMGLEAENSQYTKLKGCDTFELVDDLRGHGIRVLGSTIIGLEDHTADNIDAAIEHGVKHGTDFHQFMLYTPLPGTPLHQQIHAEGRMLSEDDCPLPDCHGQDRFNYRHRHIAPGAETEMLLRAFRRDLEVNGPSVVRVVESMLRGYQRHKNHPDPRTRRRVLREGKSLATKLTGLAWAAAQAFRDNQPVYRRLTALLESLYQEFGWKARLSAGLIGRYVRWSIAREQRRLDRGWTYEPPTFYEKNAAVAVNAGAAACRFIRPRVAGVGGCSSRTGSACSEDTADEQVPTPLAFHSH